MLIHGAKLMLKLESTHASIALSEVFTSDSLPDSPPTIAIFKFGALTLSKKGICVSKRVTPRAELFHCLELS